MKFVAIAWDGPDGMAIREAERDPHFAYIESIVDRIAVAGPLKDEAGTNIGSLLVYDVDTIAHAESLLHGDPYFKVGLWDRWSVHPFLAAAGEWVGGTSW